MRRFLHQVTDALTLTLALTVMAGLTSAAVQQPTGKPKAPKLTTDDVVRTPLLPTPGEPKEAGSKPEGEAKTNAPETKAPQAKTTDAAKASDEENSWRERVAQARNRAKELERGAEETELRITALRNELGASGQSARYRTDTIAEISQTSQRASQLRAQARIAADDAAQLVEYGRQKGFTESEGPKPTAEEGKPNEEYYRTQFAKLTEAVESAQRRIQLYDNRVRDLNQQISTNSGGRDKNGRATGGDSFFALQLQKDRDEAQQKLEEAHAALTKAQSELDSLKEEGRRAGVPPGVFR